MNKRKFNPKAGGKILIGIGIPMVFYSIGHFAFEPYYGDFPGPPMPLWAVILMNIFLCVAIALALTIVVIVIKATFDFVFPKSE